MLLFCLFLCLTSICVESAKIPEYFERCYKNDPEFSTCMRNSINNGFSHMVKGDRSINAVPINPLKVPLMGIDLKNVRINVTDFEVNYLQNLKIKDLNFDFDKKTIDLKIYLNKINVIGTYDISGKILILPINGHGPINVTFDQTYFMLSMTYELVPKGGKNYMHIIQNQMPYETKRAYFKLDNLFGGDARLGEEMNKFLDENWKEIDQEVGKGIGDGLSEVFSMLLQQIFWKLSMEELFE